MRHGVPIAFGEGLQAIVFFSGQVIINNFDIILVKHFFVSDRLEFMQQSHWSDAWSICARGP